MSGFLKATFTAYGPLPSALKSNLIKSGWKIEERHGTRKVNDQTVKFEERTAKFKLVNGDELTFEAYIHRRDNNPEHDFKFFRLSFRGTSPGGKTFSSEGGEEVEGGHQTPFILGDQLNYDEQRRLGAAIFLGTAALTKALRLAGISVNSPSMPYSQHPFDPA